MKLLCLNIWGGRVGPEKLLGFLNKHADVDVFCFQEVYAAPQSNQLDHLSPTEPDRIMWQALQEIENTLPDHQSYFHSQYKDNYGLHMLVKKSLKVERSGDIFVHKERQFIPEDSIGRRARNIQYVTIAVESKAFTVINFHGLWNGMGKDDSKERIEQSNKIVDFLGSLTTPAILAGDFNLLPDTKSMYILEQAGLRNLVKEFGITSTRTSLYSKPIKFADYILASPQINTLNFSVLPDEVSDHNALLLEFST